MRIVPPGTLTDSALLAASRDSLLAAVHVSGDTAGLAWISLASGDLRIAEVPAARLGEKLGELQPAELLANHELQLEVRGEVAVKRLEAWQFDAIAAARDLARQFGTVDLSGYGCEGLERAIGAAGALLGYFRLTPPSTLPHLLGLQVQRDNPFVMIESPKRRHPEITQTLSRSQA